MALYAVFYAVLSFLAVYFTTPWLIRYLRKIDLVVKDQNKKGLPLVPISGGLAVLTGIFAGLLLFVFIRTFLPPRDTLLILTPQNLVLLFASMITIFIITLVGFLDDLVIKKDKNSSSGLQQWQKPLLTLTAAIPLMVVKVGNTKMTLPFLGWVDFGIVYTLLLIPIGVVGAANMVNMLAGFNGLETGMGIIYTGMLGIYAYTHQSYLAALIALVAFSALLAFYFYNKYPAKILPGDSLTYLLGALLVVIAVIGNMEKATLVASVPFFLEFVLKARSKFRAQSYGYEKNGKVVSRYEQVYSLPHLLTRTGRFTEKQVAFAFVGLEFVVCLFMWVV